MHPVLVERGELGGGSTGRCAGGIRQQFSTEVNIRVGMLSRRLLARFDDEIGSPSGYRPIGYLLLATDEEQASRLRRNVALQQAVGLDDVGLVDADAVAALVPELRRDDVICASFCPSDGLAGPHEVVSGYVSAARRHGGLVVEGAEVTAVLTSCRRVEGVVVAGQQVATPLVVNCAGADAPAIAQLAGSDVPVVPLRRHIAVTNQLSLTGPTPMTVDLASSLYFHPEADGLLLGMSDRHEHPSFDVTVSWDAVGRLVDMGIDRLPVLARASLRTAWAGLYEVTPDHQAIVGPAPDLAGMWLCCGFSGHGFMQAPAIGRVLAQWIAGEEPEVPLSPFNPRRFATGADLNPEQAVI